MSLTTRDNAAAESFFSTVEWELFRITPLATKQAARREVAWFIDWYNRIRRHSSCEMNHRSPTRRSSQSHPVEVFDLDEQPRLLRAPVERYDLPVYVTAKVHRDHHITLQRDAPRL